MELPWVATTILANVVGAALRRLHTGMGDAASGCPACHGVDRSRAFALATLLDGLRDTRVRAAFQERDGLCLPHALAAIPDADPQVARLLVGTLRRRLGAPGRPGRAALTTLAGYPGADASAHCKQRTAPPEPAEREPAERVGVPGSPSGPASTLQALQDDLAMGVCPACLRAARMEHRYLDWLAADSGRALEAIEREGVEVCADHLHHLAAVDIDAARTIAASLAARAEGELAGFETDLAEPPPATIGARLLAAVRRWRRDHPPVSSTVGGGRGQAATPAVAPAAAPADPFRPSRYDLDGVRHGLLRQRECRVCQERDATAARTLRLLDAALTDAPTAAVYETSPGLCARHALDLVGAGQTADAGALVRRVAVARLGVLAWELDEAARKRAWSQRHEPPGAEAHAWRRGAALIDGMTKLTGPLSAAPLRVALWWGWSSRPRPTG
jgi:hypothetical protein